MSLPLLDGSVEASMRGAVAAAEEAGDSVGGVVECAVCGLPAGVGNPFFDSLESVLARLLSSIPAVKGVEFGDGFGLTAMRGSGANDSYCTRAAPTYAPAPITTAEFSAAFPTGCRSFFASRSNRPRRSPGSRRPWLPGGKDRDHHRHRGAARPVHRPAGPPGGRGSGRSRRIRAIALTRLFCRGCEVEPPGGELQSSPR